VTAADNEVDLAAIRPDHAEPWLLRNYAALLPDPRKGARDLPYATMASGQRVPRAGERPPEQVRHSADLLRNG